MIKLISVSKIVVPSKNSFSKEPKRFFCLFTFLIKLSSINGSETLKINGRSPYRVIQVLINLAGSNLGPLGILKLIKKTKNRPNSRLKNEYLS